MDISRWVIYVILLPLTPIMLALLIVSAQSEPSAQVEAILGGTELYFVALVALCITMRDVLTAPGAVKARTLFGLLEPILLLAIIWVAMFCWVVFTHERVVSMNFVDEFLAKAGIATLLGASGLCVATQVALAKHKRAGAVNAKRKRKPVED